VNGRHARFEALLPPGVRSLTTSDPGQGEAVAPVLSWASSPLEPPPKRPGFGISPKPHRIRDEPSPGRPQGTQPSRYVRETRIPTPGLMSPGSAGVRNRSNPHTTVRQRPSSDPRSRRVPAPATSFATSPSRMRSCEASCPRPLSAAPRASHALGGRFPGGAPAAGPRRRSASSHAWWIHLLRDGSALVEFRPSSSRLDRPSSRRRLAYPTFGREPYDRFTSVENTPSPERPRSSSTSSAHSPHPAAFAVG